MTHIEPTFGCCNRWDQYGVSQVAVSFSLQQSLDVVYVNMMGLRKWKVCINRLDHVHFGIESIFRM